MASYKVILFKNTGLNGVNTVDNVSVLNQAPHFTVPDVELMQDRNLRYINVEATFSQCEDCDYCIVGSECYSIPDGGINAKTEAVTEITLLSDPFLSAGGITVNSSGDVTARFDILDGVTQRCTVKDDSWGAYTADDPLTAPQEPLQLQTEWLNDSTGESHVFIESTVELCSQGTPNFRDGITYTDEETGETCTIPQTASLPMDSVTKVTQHTDFTIEGVKDTRGTQIYWKDDPKTDSDTTISASATIQRGLDTIRSLGQEQGSIIGQYKVPDKFLGDITVTYSGITGEATSTTVPIIGTRQDISNIKGASGKINSHISPDYAHVKNKRVLYGDYNKYGMVTCAGDSAEFNPEDLGGETAPEITYKSDPKPDGCPYYRFTTINGNTEFWRNCIKGCTWENVPLIYQGASGSALTRLNFDNERSIKSLAKQQYDESYGLRQAQNIAGIADGAISAISGGNALGAASSDRKEAMGLMNSGVSGMFSSAVNMEATRVASHQYNQMYAAQKANELSGLYQATDVYAPTVNFPYNAKLLQVIKGNGVLVYKYHMSPNDTKRVDKLLTMYGYMSAEPLTLANFGRRKHFDYVACSTISITGLPKWRCDAIAQQLKAGIRIWHELPNKKAYDDNPVRS